MKVRESERAEHDARPLLRYTVTREEVMTDFRRSLLELHQCESRPICYGHRSSGGDNAQLGAVLAERKLLNVSTGTASA